MLPAFFFGHFALNTIGIRREQVRFNTRATGYHAGTH